MNVRTLLAVPATVLALAVVSPSRAEAVGKAQPAKTIAIEVTQDGFVPAEVSAKAGQPLKLVVTRKVERTCATEIVMKDFKVNQPLPLEKPVTVTVTPKKPGEYRFACGMDMIAGVLKVD